MERDETCRQKTNLTTLGMFRDGFVVSPAVMPRLSVPPTRRGMSKGGDEKRRGVDVHAKLAVTKT